MNFMPSFTKTALKNLFSQPATRMYPQVPREYPERTRGHIEIDMSTCILCGICSRKCPADAIKVDRTGRTWSIERFGCIQCNSCVESCPKKSLSMHQTYTEPAGVKRVDTFQKPEEPPKPVEPPKAPAEQKGTESNA